MLDTFAIIWLWLSCEKLSVTDDDGLFLNELDDVTLILRVI